MEKSNRKFYLFLVIAGLLIIGLIIVIVIALSSKSAEPEEDPSISQNQVPIVELPTKIKIDDDTKTYINQNIDYAISLASPTVRVSIDDIKVRKDSIFSNYNQTTDVNYGNFIIDIPKLRQSYLVQYEWSENKDNNNLSGYPILVTCLRDQSKIIYPDFKCKDLLDLTN